MKTKPSVRLRPGLVVYSLALFGSLCAYVLAQYAVPPAADGKLAQAIAQLNAGKPQEAIGTISSIGEGQPDYARAQCYKALALYALNDKKGFWKTMDPEPVRRALPSEIKEEVWVKEMDAFLAYGKFDSLFRKIQTFEAGFPASPSLAVAKEYRLAGLVERGLKKARDASRSKDQSERDAHWSVARASLEEFLTRAAAFGHTNYAVLRDRGLLKDIWVARLLLGDGDKALAAIPGDDLAGRERFKLLRLELNLDLRREEIDENLRRLAEFLDEFPEPINRARASKAAAVLNFRKGRRLCLQAEAAEAAGDVVGAAASRDLARRFFEVQRGLQQSIVGNEGAGITSDDILEAREDLLYSYLLEKDYAQLSTLLSSTVAESEPGELNWLLAKLYEGIMLAGQTPPQADSAGKVLDEALAFGFREEHHHDRLVVHAARWRVHLLLSAGNTPRARELVQWVLDSPCRRDYRVAFSNDYAVVLALR